MDDAFDVEEVVFGDEEHPLLDIPRRRIQLTQVSCKQDRLLRVHPILYSPQGGLRMREIPIILFHKLVLVKSPRVAVALTLGARLTGRIFHAGGAVVGQT